MKGKTVLQGYLKDIKESYKKKNIFIKGNIDIDSIKKINGVISVNKKDNEYEVKIDNFDVSIKVFEIVSKGDNITKFVVEESSLNEIFVSKVGEEYEK